MRTCRGKLLICLLSSAALAAPSAAQSTYTWNSSTGTAWLSSGNWSGTPTNFPGVTGNGTGNNTGDTAAFGATLPSSLAVGIDMSIGGAKSLLELGAITFSNGSNSLLIGNSATTGTGSPQLRLDGATVSIGGVPTANVILYNSSPSQTLTIQNAVNGGTKTMGLTLASPNAVINAASGSTISISSVISESNGAPKGITLSGQGTLILSGSNTYTGNTIVSRGTLRATNTNGSATGDGTVTVLSGGRLAGTGAVVPNTATQASNSVSVSGTIQPGTDSATGYLTLGGSGAKKVNASVSGTFTWTFSNTGPSSSSPGGSDTNNSADQSRLVVNGDLTFAPRTFNVTGLPALTFDSTRPYSWRIATATGKVTVGAQPTFNVTGLNTGGGTFTLSGGVGAGYLNFTPIPEPTTILLLCGVAAGTVMGVRRWRNRGSGICRSCLPQGEVE
jgi:fibronectin-binding autotransporter adhesin